MSSVQEPALDPPIGPAAVQSRMSGKAALAGMLALLSASGCVVSLLLVTLGWVRAFAAIFALPLLGIAAVVLGFTALREIKRASGAMHGRVPALIGVFLGLMLTVVQAAVGMGALRTYMDLRNNLAPSMGRLFIALDRAEDATAQMHLSAADQGPSVAARTAAADELRARFGACRGATFDLRTISQGAALVSTAPKNANVAADIGLPRSVRLVYERAEPLLLVWLDDDALQKNEVRLRDGMIVLSPDGVSPAEALLMRPDGPASKAATALGIRVVTPHAAP